jgi:hypothetical protein
MRYLSAILIIVTLLITLTPATSPQNYLTGDEWRISSTEVLYPFRPFRLSNDRAKNYLLYRAKVYSPSGGPDFGINLKWDQDARTPNFTVERRGGSATPPIMYWETVALREAKGGYLKYGEQGYGINLRWSRTPAYEWQIVGGERGQPVGTLIRSIGEYRTKVSLLNTTINKYVIYGRRENGISLVWTDIGKRTFQD